MGNDREARMSDLASQLRSKGISAEMAEKLRGFFRENVREMFVDVMMEEVELLCGPRHRPNPGAEYFRAGTAPGYVLNEGRRMDVVRPRVRRNDGTGGTGEEPLATYANAQEPGELHRRMLEAFEVGVSGRDQERLHGENTPGVSKSEVSRLWRREGEKRLAAFRARDIARKDWLVLMLDGIWLSKDLMAVVALGVAEDGTKHLLDFELGAAESTETAKGLVERLSRRGFAPAEGCRLLAVLDGAAALRTAVLAYWPDTVVQRCLVHKERNIRRFLRKQDYKELARHFDRLRKAQGLVAGREALRELERFVGERNKAALESLREAGEELLALHRLEVPATLNVSLLSTNLIESPFKNVRKKLERVNRWDAGTDQPSRWLAYGLTEAERGFRRVRHAEDLKALRKALEKPKAAGMEKASCAEAAAAV
jgi:transposase-like protein